MATLIQSYEQQYSILTAELTSKIGRLKVGNEDNRDQLSKEIQHTFEEVNDLLEQLELESRGVGAGSRVAAYRAELQRVRDEYRSVISNNSTYSQLEQLELESRGVGAGSRVAAYRAELQRVRDEYRSVISNNSTYNVDNDEVYDEWASNDQHQRLLDNTERVERSGKTLTEGYRVVLETEQIGAAVLQDLSIQRETIQRSRGRLRETDEQLNRSSRLMNSMIVRALQDRFILVIVFFILGILTCAGLYFYVT